MTGTAKMPREPARPTGDRAQEEPARGAEACTPSSAAISASPRVRAQREMIQAVFGPAAAPGRKAPTPAATIQRKLDWTVDKLAAQLGPQDADIGYRAVVDTLREYLRLQNQHGDGPHLVTSLERLSVAAERYMGRGADRSPAQQAALELFRDACNERDRMAGIRDVAAQSPAFQAFDATKNPDLPKKTMRIPASAVLGKIVEGKPASAGTLTKGLTTEITGNFGGYWGFSLNDNGVTYIVEKSAVSVLEQEHQAIDGDLFPVEPSPDHVKQGKIGDCFLLAPAASIAAMNPGFIKTMMKQNTDGSVTVRFFAPEGPSGKKTFAPRYISVEKSIVTVAHTAVYATGALWVQMLEKAYAMSQLGTQEGKPKDRNTYGNLSGGQSSEALEILLGREVRVRKLDGDRSDPMNPINEFRHYNREGMPWGAAEQQAIDAANEGTAAWEGSLVYSLIGDRDLTLAWRKFIGSETIADLFADNQKLLKDRSGRKYEEAITLEDIEELLLKHVAASIVTAVVGYLGEQQLFPGRRGTGRYTKENLALYEDLQKACDEHKVITADTPDVISIDQTSSGESANEPKGGGLVGQHAYSVLAVKAEAGVRYVQVRNPWGRYGRTYAADGRGVLAPQAVDQGDGLSWIELVDFQKRFKQLNY